MLFLVILSVAIATVNGYSSGAPMDPEVCESLIPKHPGSPQTSPSPYLVEVDKQQVAPGEVVQVGISSETILFKGFLVQARRAGGSNDVTPRGLFSKANNPHYKTLKCAASEDTITHKSAEDKTHVSLKWVAPKEKGIYIIL